MSFKFKTAYGDGPVLGLPANARPTPKKNTRRLRILSYLVLVSTAATLSTVLPLPWSFLRTGSLQPVTLKRADPASEFQDNIWPLREQTPWDISTDFPHPRTLEYDVTEGTWLRLDVHPTSGDIIFDMIGDIYCLPGQEALNIRRRDRIRARPVILGIPHDVDPHFSPEGDRIVFKSDAELGLDNIWVMEWKGCEAMDVRASDTTNEELQDALGVKEFEEKLFKQGVVETVGRKYHRLVREGRAGARRVTNETYRSLSDPRFHPSGDRIVATKWYTSSRSLGAGEGWQYEVPSLHGEQEPINIGSGSRVVARTVPPGATADDYERQQIGPEMFIWNGEDSLIFAKNIRDSNTFDYSKDVHNGIYSIFQKNLTTSRTETIVDAFPGGASRPQLSRDGRTLAFVRRVRDKEALVFKDLKTGSIHNIWHGLTYDLTMVSAPMGTYPSFAFTPSDDAVIIWAAGQIHHVPITCNDQGEKVAANQDPSPILFIAHIEQHIAETRREHFNILKQETRATQRVHAFRDLRVNDAGDKAIFEGAGKTYIQDLKKKRTLEIPVASDKAPYYSPTFVHGKKEFVLHAQWSDTKFTSFELANVETGAVHRFEGLPLGRYFSPILCECDGSERRLAFIKSDGDNLTGDLIATANPGLYLAGITLPSHSSDKITIRNLQHIPSGINPSDRVEMRFIKGAKQLVVQQSGSAFSIDLAQGPNENGEFNQTNIVSGRTSTELSVTLNEKKKEFVAFVDFMHVYIAPGDKIEDGEAVWSKPGNATKGLARVSLDGGHDITWSKDGKTVFWFLGEYLHSLEVAKLKKCSKEIEADPVHFGINCVKKLVEYQDVFVEHSTDIARLKKEADSFYSNQSPHDESDVLVITNATILTMATGDVEKDLIRNGVIVTRGGVIVSVGPASSDIRVPVLAQTINAHGGLVVPGFIDVHAHWSGFSVRYPTKSWELETFLAYGITTLHNPSADNVRAPIERSRVERGQQIGPRIFTVGDVIYGAGEASIHQDIIDLEEAKEALVRIKAEGGPGAISYKNYQLPVRASRQRLLLAAQNLSMLCVPEGGMTFDWDIAFIVDGMTTVEHAIPVPTLYDDVLTLFALSGTGSTPTHIVNYGGAFGEQFMWANYDVPNDPKLRRFTRHDILEGITESTARPKNSYAFFNTSTSVAKMVDMGLLAHIGAHGEPPLGLNYHAEMWFTSRGGLSNYEVIRAATSSAARTLGLFSSLGSISEGKLADYIIYPSDVDILNGDISRSPDIAFVARGGRLWDANTMEEVWPVKGRKQVMPPINPE